MLQNKGLKFKFLKTMVCMVILNLLKKISLYLCARNSQVLATTRSSKNVTRVTKCLDQIVLGLVENESLRDSDLILLAKGLVTESIPQLKPTSGPGSKSDAAANKKRDRRLRPDGEIYLIPAEPKRAGPAPKSAVKTHAHLFVETGFQLLHTSLRRSKVSADSMKRASLDPFLPHLIECLDSPTVKVRVKLPFPAFQFLNDQSKIFNTVLMV